MEQLNLRFDIPLALVSPDELYQNAEMFLSLLKEDRRFERKSPKTSPRTLGEYFSMWANKVPDGGLIAIGIEDGVVYDSQGHAWTRIGDQKHELSKDQCREIEIDKGQVDFEQEEILDIAYPDAFDVSRITLFVESFRKSRGLSYEQT